MTPITPRPIFIIGCPRSGTTLLRMMIDSHPRLSCGEETKFLTRLSSILGWRWPFVEVYGFGREYWVRRIRDFHEGFQLEYMARRGKSRWADKDPANTLHLKFVDELFPDAQYVHIIRDGHDVVASWRDLWGYRSGLGVARGRWARYVRAGRKFGKTLPADRYYEVRYERLVTEPEAAMRELLEFLGEPWDDAVLDFDEAEHAAGPIGDKPFAVRGRKPTASTTDGAVVDRHKEQSDERRRQAGETATIYRSRVGAGRKSLDPVLRLLLRRSSGKLLRELGY